MKHSSILKVVEDKNNNDKLKFKTAIHIIGFFLLSKKGEETTIDSLLLPSVSFFLQNIRKVMAEFISGNQTPSP